jgi:hypothetical protein
MPNVDLSRAKSIGAGAPENDLGITDEMVSVAAEVLWRDPFAGISRTVAELMTAKMLTLALSVRHGRIAAGDHEAE